MKPEPIKCIKKIAGKNVVFHKKRHKVAFKDIR